MKSAGQIALIRFPNVDLAEGKLRPTLLLCRASRRYDDWLACMISSRLRQAEPDIDEILSPADIDFAQSGLKAPSVIRLTRLAVVKGDLLVGKLGEIAPERTARLRARLAAWLREDHF